MDLLRKFKDKYGEGIKKSVVECAELPDQGIAELTEAEHAVRRSRPSGSTSGRRPLLFAEETIDKGENVTEKNIV